MEKAARTNPDYGGASLPVLLANPKGGKVGPPPPPVVDAI
jgi:hypothetical protein